MVFLLVWLAVPVTGVQSQEFMPVNKTYHFEGQSSHPESDGNDNGQPVPAFNQYDLNNQDNGLELPPNFARSAEFIAQKRKERSGAQNRNYIRLFTKGQNNHVTATQEQGTNNIMDLGVRGYRNQGDYLQKGNENYIYDRIKGSDIPHTIHQEGNNLGIYNQGMQSLPLIIRQKGAGMKLRITGGPGT